MKHAPTPVDKKPDSAHLPNGSLLLSRQHGAQDYEPDALDVRISELLVATADGSDPLISPSVYEVLRLLREHMHMDVTFIAEFTNGHRVFRRVNADPAKRVIEEGQSNPLDQSLCQCVVDGRLPQAVPDMAAHRGDARIPQQSIPLGAHLSVPIVLHDGQVYGTLCAFSQTPNPELSQREVRKLELTANLIAQKMQAREASLK